MVAVEHLHRGVQWSYDFSLSETVMMFSVAMPLEFSFCTFPTNKRIARFFHTQSNLYYNFQFSRYYHWHSTENGKWIKRIFRKWNIQTFFWEFVCIDTYEYVFCFLLRIIILPHHHHCYCCRLHHRWCQCQRHMYMYKRKKYIVQLQKEQLATWLCAGCFDFRQKYHFIHLKSC